MSTFPAHNSCMISTHRGAAGQPHCLKLHQAICGVTWVKLHQCFDEKVHDNDSMASKQARHDVGR